MCEQDNRLTLRYAAGVLRHSYFTANANANANAGGHKNGV